jgi:hypothetical protein
LSSNNYLYLVVALKHHAAEGRGAGKGLPQHLHAIYSYHPIFLPDITERLICVSVILHQIMQSLQNFYGTSAFRNATPGFT